MFLDFIVPVIMSTSSINATVINFLKNKMVGKSHPNNINKIQIDSKVVKGLKTMT